MPGVSGPQLYLVEGYSILFKREDENGTSFPWIDFGDIDSVTPTFTINKLEKKAANSGILRKVDEAVIEFIETYQIVVSNLAPDILALFMSADEPEDLVRAATPVTEIKHQAFLGKLLQLLDADFDAPSPGNPASLITSIENVTSEYETVTAVDTSGSPFSFSFAGTPADAALYAAADSIIVKGNTGLGVDTVFTIVTATETAGTVEVEVVESNAGATADGTLAIKYTLDSDYEETNLTFGVIKILSGGLITDLQDVFIDYTPEAISGERRINPQTGAGSISGQAQLLARSNNDQHIYLRFCEIDLTPVSRTGGDAQSYSTLTFDLSVVNDLQAAVPAGRLDLIKGSLPDSA